MALAMKFKKASNRLLSGEILCRWEDLNKAEIEECAGDRLKLTALIETRYGYARRRAEKEVELVTGVQISGVAKPIISSTATSSRPLAQARSGSKQFQSARLLTTSHWSSSTNNRPAVIRSLVTNIALGTSTLFPVSTLSISLI